MKYLKKFPKELPIVCLLSLSLGACVGTSTEDVGSPVKPDGLTNAPGMNSFVVDIDPTTGNVEHVLASLAKDDTGLVASVEKGTDQNGNPYEKWTFSVDSSKGSEQTKAVLAAVEAVANAQAETAQKVGPEALKALVEGLKTVYGVR